MEIIDKDSWNSKLSQKIIILILQIVIGPICVIKNLAKFIMCCS
jgi:hypothetical protein